MGKSIKDNMDEFYKSSALHTAESKLKFLWKQYGKLFIIGIILEFLISSWLLGSLTVNGMVRRGELASGGLFTSIAHGVTNPLTFILFGFLMYASYNFIFALNREENYVEDGNYSISGEGVKGTAQLMEKEEKEETFDAGGYDTIEEFILGAEPANPNTLYSLKETYGINRNILFTGSPGSGKSRSYCIPGLLQIIRRGESAFVMDPKTELYNVVSATARAHGYTVKVINFDPFFMLHSDCVNI